MFKLKPVLNYLGEPSYDLNQRAIARCPTCSAPDLPPADNPFFVGAEWEGVVNKVRPRLTTLDTSRVALSYLSNSGDTVYMRILTVGTDASLTVGTEYPKVMGGASIHDTDKFDTDKIILVMCDDSMHTYAMVVTLTGNVVAYGTVRNPNNLVEAGQNFTVHVRTIDTTRALLVFEGYDGGVAAATQILTISGSTITGGAFSTTSAFSSGSINDLQVMSATRALFTTSTRFGIITMSGTTAAFSTLKSFPVAAHSAQFPARVLTYSGAKINRVSDLVARVNCQYGLTGPVENGYATFEITNVEVGGLDSNETFVEASTTGGGLDSALNGSTIITAHRDVVGGIQRIGITKYTASTVVRDELLVTVNTDPAETPVITHVTGYLYCVAYATAAGAIKAIAVNMA